MAGKKWPKEKKGDDKNGRWKKSEGKKNNISSNFSTTANVVVRIFFFRLLDLTFELILSESFH